LRGASQDFAKTSDVDSDAAWAGCQRLPTHQWAHGATPLHFIHIPRAGGTSIESCSKFFPQGTERWGQENSNLKGLQGLGGKDGCYRQHVPPSILVDKPGPPTVVTNANRQSTFCVVRNPYDRLISQFGFAHIFLGGQKCSKESMNKYLVEELRKVKAGRPFLADCHFTPQTFFVFGYNNKTHGVDRQQRWCQHALRFDELSKNFNNLMQHFGYPINLQQAKGKDTRHMASTPECRKLSIDDLSPEVVELANEIYKEDFEFLSFKKISKEAVAKSETSFVKLTPGKIPVWVLYSFTEQNKNSLIELNIKAMRRHLGNKFELVLVNETNERQLVPDLPEEYFRLPDFGARSDAMRAALLAKHGGIYLDGDVLITQNLDTFGQRLANNDVVAYTTEGQDCNKGHFSSNAMACKKGSKMFAGWWNEAKREMRQKCDFIEKEDLKNGVCCYTPTGESRRCHVNWGGLGETLGHKELKKLLGEDQKTKEQKAGSQPRSRAVKDPFKISCLQEKSYMGLAPDPQGKILWRELMAPPRVGETTKCNGNDCPCWEPPRKPWGDLECADGKKVQNFFGRPGFHLFSHINGHYGKRPEEEILKGTWVVSRLYRAALGTREPSPPEFKLPSNTKK
jgi:hypothetical protein